MTKKLKRKTPGGAKPMGQAGMLNQLQQMQEDMARTQAELENETLDISVGGGAVTITISGHQRIQKLEINREMIDLEDEEWLTDLQDLLMAAFNQAVEKSQALSAERMDGIAGGMSDMLPGGLGGLFG